MTEFSRWLSEALRATPPESKIIKSHPERVPEIARQRCGFDPSGIPSGCCLFADAFRWCRSPSLVVDMAARKRAPFLSSPSGHRLRRCHLRASRSVNHRLSRCHPFGMKSFAISHRKQRKTGFCKEGARFTVVGVSGFSLRSEQRLGLVLSADGADEGGGLGEAALPSRSGLTLGGCGARWRHYDTHGNRNRNPEAHA